MPIATSGSAWLWARAWYRSVSLHYVSPGFPGLSSQINIGPSMPSKYHNETNSLNACFEVYVATLESSWSDMELVGCVLYSYSRWLDSCWYSHVTDVAFCCWGAVLEIRGMTGYWSAPSMLMLLKGLKEKKSCSLLWKTSCFWKADYSEVWILETDFLPSVILPCLCNYLLLRNKMLWVLSGVVWVLQFWWLGKISVGFSECKKGKIELISSFRQIPLLPVRSEFSVCLLLQTLWLAFLI